MWEQPHEWVPLVILALVPAGRVWGLDAPSAPPRHEEVRPLAVLDQRPPLGSRLWLYTNFDCNLACDYCCARSSPRAPARRLPVDVARRACEEFAGLGGREILLTGGEPFLDPELPALVDGGRPLGAGDRPHERHGHRRADRAGGCSTRSIPSA